MIETVYGAALAWLGTLDALPGLVVVSGAWLAVTAPWVVWAQRAARRVSR